MLTLVLAASAWAQEAPVLNSQLFRPSPDARATLWTEDTHTEPDGYMTGRAFAQYANGVLRTDAAGGGTERLVSDLLEVDLAGATWLGGFRLAAHAPLYLLATSEVATDGAGLGDLAFDVKRTLLDGSKAPVGVAALARLTLPTSSVAAPLGASATGWELLGVVDGELGGVRLAGNVGTRGVPETRYGDLVWNDQFLLRLGAGYALTEFAGISLDVASQTNWASGRNPAGTAVEAMAGGHTKAGRSLVLRGGLSTGLTRAPGAPLFRGVVGVSWEPDPHPDRDFDGVVDRDDLCPDEPEDLDGFEDTDGCMDRTVTVAVRWADADGTVIDAAQAKLTGPETHRIDGGTAWIDVHPGRYVITSTAPDYEQRQVELFVPTAVTSMSSTQTLVRSEGSLRLWAVDDAGTPMPADVRVGGVELGIADGTPLALPTGEHSVVFALPGHTAHAVSLALAAGQERSYTAVLAPSSEQAERPDRAGPGADARTARR